AGHCSEAEGWTFFLCGPRRKGAPQEEVNPVDHPHGGGEGKAPIGRKNPQPLGVILRLEKELGKGKNIDNLIFLHIKK
ncbi:unnamed protein product, partial [Urochloa humidicola]